MRLSAFSLSPWCVAIFPMTTLDNRLLGQVAQGLASDSRSLDSLKREAQADPRAAAKKAATQFEALFMQMVLKSMRDAMPKSGMLDSSAREMYTGLLDQQLATKVAASGTGLADLIAKQLTRHMAAGGKETSPASATSSRPEVDRYAELARANPIGAARSAQLAMPGADSPVREAYLARAPLPPAMRGPGVTDGRYAAAEGASAAPDAATHSARRDFVNRHWDHALAAERLTGIPAKFIVGQAALESGWGHREIRDAFGMRSHNVFGIKAGTNWRGRTVEVTTTEYVDGNARKVVEKFRAYNNYSEAFRDWARLLTSQPRYAQVLRDGRDVHGFAFGLQRAGYATDPQYGDKLARVIGTTSVLRGAV